MRLHTFALPSTMVPVSVAEIGYRVHRGSLGVVGDEGGGKVQWMLRQTFWVIGDERGREIEGVFRQTLRVIRYEYGLEVQWMLGERPVLRNVGRGEVQGVLGQSLRVVRHERRGQVEGMLGERELVLAQDGGRGGGQRQHAALQHCMTL